jgi:hypothetical protein
MMQGALRAMAGEIQINVRMVLSLPQSGGRMNALARRVRATRAAFILQHIALVTSVAP